MAVFFLLVMVTVQIGFLIISRSITSAAVDATARRVAHPDAVLDDERTRLEAEIEASVPGAELGDVAVERRGDSVVVSVRFRWHPPGPDLVPVEVSVSRSRSVMVPP